MSSSMDGIYERMRDDTEDPDFVYETSHIRRHFAGKKILFTGATGYMGKCFVEKILRDCPDLGKLYLLVRQKKGVEPEDKIKKYFQNFIFDRLRNQYPDFESKVVTVRGDLQEDRLGLSEKDRQELIDNVDIIIHNGATTKFDEIISVSLKINVLATKHMLDLAMDCKHVESFIYISTAYSHCYNQDIEEKFYPAPGDLALVDKMIERDTNTPGGLPEDEVKKILGKWPNIYCFTKSIAEDLVRQYGEKAPFGCAVYRPSIVTGAYKEPLPGWVGNNNGPAYIFVGVGLGAVHTCYYKGDPMDLVPVDYSINSILAAAYDIPQRWKKEKKALVYNYGSSMQTPVRLNELFDFLRKEAPKIGCTKMLWYQFCFFVKSKWLFWLNHILFHFFPALLADFALLCMGQKTRALSIFWFATKHLEKVFYFTNGNWRIHSNSTLAICDKLNETDKRIFPFDMRNFDWEDCTAYYVRGVRVYVVNDPLDNIEVAKKHFRRLQFIHYTFVTVVGLLAAYYVFGWINCLINIFF